MLPSACSVRTADRNVACVESGRPTPGRLLLRNFWFCSIEDPSAFRALDLIGADNILAECDYPHQDSTARVASMVDHSWALSNCRREADLLRQRCALFQHPFLRKSS